VGVFYMKYCFMEKLSEKLLTKKKEVDSGLEIVVLLISAWIETR